MNPLVSVQWDGSAKSNFFAFIFQLRGTFVLQVRGLQVPGPPCGSFLLKLRTQGRGGSRGGGGGGGGGGGYRGL